jgi:type I restriction enzyme R subunit
LKTAVVISSDGTNEAAFVTQARKKRALERYQQLLQAFDLDDPDGQHRHCFPDRVRHAAHGLRCAD